MRLLMLGNKLGMTQVFEQNGTVIPVTVLKIGPCWVVDKRTEEKNGYNAVILAYEDIKENRTRKSEEGQFKKAKLSPKRYMRESRVTKEELDKFEIGQEVNIDLFKKGDFVDISGRSKGRGFTGVMKRHGMAGAKRSHGTHEYFRHGGSIGASASPSRVFKGKKMAGRYGGTRVTLQNLVVADVRPDKSIMIVKGAVPGPNRGNIEVAHSIKRMK
ncbi:MAG: 50S ribosomal protein L3 [Spirochaetota bacterium]|nr:MAG: 50S ribosomal protein L3 [Spirochaetota bacterium]